MQKDILGSKIDDFTRYVNLAVQNIQNQDYSGSAIHARKAAEAACKLIIYNAFNLKMAEEKISGKTLRELITQLIKDKIADRKSINNIETIQIIGNRAAHDNPVTKEEAVHCVIALSFLTEYLFKENLKTAIPSAINFNLEEPAPVSKSPEIVEKIIITEKSDPAKEAEWLQKLSDLEKQNKDLQNQFLQNKEELKAFVTDRTVTTPVSIPLEKKPELASPPTSSSGNRRVWIFLGVLVTFSLTVVVLVLINTKNPEAQQSITQSPDTFYVAINRLVVMQDNPSVDFKIENILQSTILNKIRSFSLPVKISFTELKDIDFNNDTLVLKRARESGYNIIYFGNLYETALGDSNIIEIKTAFFDRSKPLTFGKKKFSFKTLADSVFIKKTNDIANAVAFSYCESLLGSRNDNLCADLLGSLRSYSEPNNTERMARHANCLRRVGSCNESISEFRLLSQLHPANLYYLWAIGDNYAELKKYDSAAVYYDKVLAVDSIHGPTLYNYGIAFALRRNYPKALSYLGKALRTTSAVPAAKLIKSITALKKGEFLATGEFNLTSDSAHFYFDNGQPKKALVLFIRAAELDPMNQGIVDNLARCYYTIGDTIKAFETFHKAYQMDSTNERTLVSYATWSGISACCSSSTTQLYNRAISLFPGNLSLVQFASGYFLRKGIYERVKEVCRLAASRYSTDYAISFHWAWACMLTNDFRCAKEKFELVNALHPSDTVNVCLADCYLRLNRRNVRSEEFIRGLKLLQDALAINPNNREAMVVLNQYSLAVHVQKTRESQANNPLTLKMIKEAERVQRSKPLSEIKIYASTTTSVILRNQNTIAIRRCFPDGTSRESYRILSGGSGDGEQCYKGKRPPPRSEMPSGPQIIDWIVNSKKINKKDKALALQIELQFHESRKFVTNKEAEDNKLLIQKINSALMALNQK